MIRLPDGSTATPRQILTALVSEAHRRGVSYGDLAGLDNCAKAEIVAAWWEQHKEDLKAVHACQGCKYWRPLTHAYENTLWVCNYLADTGRRRSRDEDGNCMEWEDVHGKRKSDSEG